MTGWEEKSSKSGVWLKTFDLAWNKSTYFTHIFNQPQKTAWLRTRWTGSHLLLECLLSPSKTHTLLISLGYLKRVRVKIFNLYVQSCFLFYFFLLCQLCFSNFVKNDRKPISFFSPPFIDPAVHSTSIYSSYLAWRPKKERKVKTDVKLSWLLWLKRNLGGGKLAAVSISRAEGCGMGACFGFENVCIQ